MDVPAEPNQDVEAAPTEATARQLLGVVQAWPLAADVRGRQAFSRGMIPLLTRLRQKERFAFFYPHDFQPDRISEWVVKRNAHTESYAASFKVASDHSLPADVLDAVQHNHQPQFILRNIGRAERGDVDPTAPLPFDRISTDRNSAHDEVAAVRNARMPKVKEIEIWSLRMVNAVRSSFRRILIEDPWEWRYGAEVRANYPGPSYQYVVEGTHPDDLPDAWWGPEMIPIPTVWVKPPAGTEHEERAVSVHDVIRIVSRETG
jgi:hypothetical protein